MSSLLYVSFLVAYSSSLIAPTNPKTCDARLPEVYETTGSVITFIPASFAFCSLICTAEVLLISLAITTDLVLLYPFLEISYLTAMIFLAKALSSSVTSYSSFNALNACSAEAFSSMSYVFFHSFCSFSSSYLNLKGSTSIGRLSTNLSSLLSKISINLFIDSFNSASETLVLYISTLYPVSVPTNSIPVLSFIEPLAAFTTDSLVSLEFDGSLYSSPWIICKLNNCSNKIIPAMYTIVVRMLYLILSPLLLSPKFLPPHLF